MNKKVLVVDDEEIMRALVEATLANDDRYRVITAADGAEAVRIALETKPDLVLLDILMPHMDGYEVCRRLRTESATAEVKIIMLTALAQETDRRRAVEAGAYDYLIKPFSPTALLEQVEQLFETSSAGAQVGA